MNLNTSCIHLTLVVGMLSTLTACSRILRNPVPPQQLYEAKILGHNDYRYWSNKKNNNYVDDLLLSMEQESQAKQTKGKLHTSINILAISGGGHNGAFGAGLLDSWSKTGNRPEFKIVTGISTGAVIAPFAFLGQKYDPVLKSIYTEHSEKNVYRISLFKSLRGGSLLDTAPYTQLIEKVIDKPLLKKIAIQHTKGRRLYIGTTHLDADQFTVWNMGAIANSNHPGALDLFRKVIIASSAIPPAFSPVLLKVRINNKVYDEMHVDGGIKAQLFIIATALDMARLRKKLINKLLRQRKIRIFAIRNGFIAPEPETTKRSAIVIAKRALSSLIKSQALNDIKRIYSIARAQNAEFYWVAIPKNYKPLNEKEFNQEEMRHLFKLGVQTGLKPDMWSTADPH